MSGLAGPCTPKSGGAAGFHCSPYGRFDGPAVAPFVRVEDVERINPEAIWTALS